MIDYLPVVMPLPAMPATDGLYQCPPRHTRSGQPK